MGKQVIKYLLSIFFFLLVPTGLWGGYYFDIPQQELVLTPNSELVMAQCPQFSQYDTGESSSGLGDRFTVFSWNIYKEQSEGWKPLLKENAGQSQIVLLQEAALTNELTGLFTELDLNWLLTKAFTADKVPMGVAMAFQTNPRAVCQFRIAEPFIVFPKTAMAAKFPFAASPQTLLVLNIHGINFSLGLTEFATQLDALTQTLEHHSGPVLFAGDFNTWSAQRKLLVREKLGKFGLQEAQLSPDNRVTIFGHAIDHLFYSGLKQINAKGVATKASDHNPILAEFEMIKPE